MNVHDGARGDKRKARVTTNVDVFDSRIMRVLADHAYVPSGARGVSRCACDKQFHGMPDAHRAHVAAELSDVVAEIRAVAWDEGVIAGAHCRNSAIWDLNPYRNNE